MMTDGPAQLHVLISGGFSGAYEKLLPEFTRTSGIKVTTGSGASQGTGPHTIAAQLARGVKADVVILSREGLGELIAANRIAAGTDADLASVPLGVAVCAGTPKPDLRSVEAFKQCLLAAKTVAVPASTSGIWLTADLRGRCRSRSDAAERNYDRARRRRRKQPRRGDPVRAGIFGRRGRRLGTARRFQATDRVSRITARGRSHQGERHGAVDSSLTEIHFALELVCLACQILTVEKRLKSAARRITRLDARL
jgi:hypothetical protein